MYDGRVFQICWITFEILYFCGCWSVAQMMDGHWQWKVISSEVATMNARSLIDLGHQCYLDG